MRYNNFDLLRILAALQVAVVHAIEHFDLERGSWYGVLTAVPGVPIFFVISGFLVSASLERSRNLRSYFTFRFLRIYPALWVCLLVSILLAAGAGVSFASAEAVPWVIAQVTIVQFYNPDFLRGFGVGVLNGSLWTIPVELQFYIALPALYWLLRRTPRPNMVLAAIMLAGIATNRLVANFMDHDSLSGKLIAVTLAPHLYLFLVGVALQQQRALVEKYLQGKAHLWIALYALVAMSLHKLGLYVHGNSITPVAAILLGVAAISAAYTLPSLHRVLFGGDISYGLYIYHMPVINFCIAASMARNFTTAALAISAAIVFATTSWLLVEKPALALKHRLNQLAVPA